MSMTVTQVLIIVFAVAALICLQFPMARWLAALTGWKKVNILGGVAQYVVWKKNEIVIFERDGELMEDFLELDKKTKGGARVISILRGERIAGRVWFVDHEWSWQGKAATREGIKCNLKVVVNWVVDAENVSDYVYENRSAKQLNKNGEIDAWMIAEDLFKGSMGPTVNSTFSHESLFEMVILNLPKYRSDHQGSYTSDVIESSVEQISKKLAATVQQGYSKKAQKHGIELVGIVASVEFADEVGKKALDTFLTIFEPLQAEQLAEAERIMNDTQTESYIKKLDALVKLLGRPFTQMQELFKHLSAGSISNSAQEELAKAMISAFWSQNSERRLESEGTAADATEPPKD